VADWAVQRASAAGHVRRGRPAARPPVVMWAVHRRWSWPGFLREIERLGPRLSVWHDRHASPRPHGIHDRKKRRERVRGSGRERPDMARRSEPCTCDRSRPTHAQARRRVARDAAGPRTRHAAGHAGPWAGLPTEEKQDLKRLVRSRGRARLRPAAGTGSVLTSRDYVSSEPGRAGAHVETGSGMPRRSLSTTPMPTRQRPVVRIRRDRDGGRVAAACGQSLMA
jgi:hypothetical protein